MTAATYANCYKLLGVNASRALFDANPEVKKKGAKEIERVIDYYQKKEIGRSTEVTTDIINCLIKDLVLSNSRDSQIGGVIGLVGVARGLKDRLKFHLDDILPDIAQLILPIPSLFVTSTNTNPGCDSSNTNPGTGTGITGGVTGANTQAVNTQVSVGVKYYAAECVYNLILIAGADSLNYLETLVATTLALVAVGDAHLIRAASFLNEALESVYRKCNAASAQNGTSIDTIFALMKVLTNYAGTRDCAPLILQWFVLLGQHKHLADSAAKSNANNSEVSPNTKSNSIEAAAAAEIGALLGAGPSLEAEDESETEKRTQLGQGVTQNWCRAVELLFEAITQALKIGTPSAAALKLGVQNPSSPSELKPESESEPERQSPANPASTTPLPLDEQIATTLSQFVRVIEEGQNDRTLFYIEQLHKLVQEIMTSLQAITPKSLAAIVLSMLQKVTHTSHTVTVTGRDERAKSDRLLPLLVLLQPYLADGVESALNLLPCCDLQGPRTSALLSLSPVNAFVPSSSDRSPLLQHASLDFLARKIQELALDPQRFEGSMQKSRNNSFREVLRRLTALSQSEDSRVIERAGQLTRELLVTTRLWETSGPHEYITMSLLYKEYMRRCQQALGAIEHMEAEHMEAEHMSASTRNEAEVESALHKSHFILEHLAAYINETDSDEYLFDAITSHQAEMAEKESLAEVEDAGADDVKSEEESEEERDVISDMAREVTEICALIFFLGLLPPSSTAQRKADHARHMGLGTSAAQSCAKGNGGDIQKFKPEDKAPTVASFAEWAEDTGGRHGFTSFFAQACRALLQPSVGAVTDNEENTAYSEAADVLPTVSSATPSNWLAFQSCLVVLFTEASMYATHTRLHTNYTKVAELLLRTLPSDQSDAMSLLKLRLGGGASSGAGLGSRLEKSQSKTAMSKSLAGSLKDFGKAEAAIYFVKRFARWHLMEATLSTPPSALATSHFYAHAPLLRAPLSHQLSCPETSSPELSCAAGNVHACALTQSHSHTHAQPRTGTTSVSHEMEADHENDSSVVSDAASRLKIAVSLPVETAAMATASAATSPGALSVADRCVDDAERTQRASESVA